MPTRGIQRLSFDYGIEEVRPFERRDRVGLPDYGDLPPSSERPSSMLEDLVRQPGLSDMIDDFVRPSVADASICRPELYGRLLEEAELALRDIDPDDPELGGLARVLAEHNDMRDLLHYYLQSLLNA